MRKAHTRLLGEYVAVLNSLPKSGEDGFRTTRLLTHLHMRKRLKLVQVAYVQIAQTLNDEGVAAYREWLNDAEAGLQSMIETLTAWRRPSILALIPLAIGIYSSIFDKVAVSSLVVYVLLGYSLFFGFLLLPVVWEGFFVKRRLFAPPTEDDQAGSRNVYAREDELFSLIGRVKPREAPLDQFILTVIPFMLVEIPALVFTLAQDWTLNHIFWLLPVFLLGLLSLIPILKRAKRIRAERPG